VTLQSEILELLREVQRERRMAILLVTHDWGVVADICDRAVVMYAGQVVEHAVLGSLFRAPLHPYTKALLAANPHDARGRGALTTIPGAVPRPGYWPEGCHFGPRCGYAILECREHAIPLERTSDGRLARCIRHAELAGLSTKVPVGETGARSDVAERPTGDG
jgi:peptide/nickel transport system permease protein